MSGGNGGNGGSQGGLPVPRAVRALARRHGIGADEVLPAPFQGVAGTVFLLGEHLVVKVARPEPGCAADLRKEALVVPFATGLGLRTPELVAYGEGDEDLPGPWAVLRRAHGRAANEPGPRAYRELGRELALLHGASVPPGVAAGVPRDEPADPAPGIERLVAAGYLSAGLGAWLTGWLAELAAARPAPPGPVLIHGDVSAANLVLGGRSGGLVALLDWGDAALADPAAEFAKVPLRRVPEVLTGYLGGLPDADTGRAWAAGVLTHHLAWAVARLPTPPDTRGGHWSAQPGNRLLELLRAYAEGLPSPWAAWMRSKRLP
ncbi:aminoglycoside phosphotransferase family protein [Streptomyces johnsoniae]|uniref:Phosphotransferase n=1 Tax=Streptomyces johnsoniae TaxID=3075532 RepID=A0ABU2SBF8_9ACTN|nr:phosphotransferase [Streptomyces sp. DSM 41886]MDT0446011.1 phosphotransferase [Streptomyces sp. DSM 41886]